MTSEPPSRILLLLRHGKAESFADTDAARALTDKGHSQAALIGEYLKSQGVIPSQVLFSTATRATETWQTVRKALAHTNISEQSLDSLYLGGVSETLEAIRNVSDDDRVVLVVAHEPTMSQLAAYLSDDETSDSSALAQVRIGVPTGSMSVLTSSADSWSAIAEGELTLLTLVRS